MKRSSGLFASAVIAAALVACASNSGTSIPNNDVAPAQSANSAQPATPSLIKNGGFEKPVVSPGSFQIFSTGQKFSKWTVTGANGNVAIVSGTFTQNGFKFPAKSGKQWLDLTGTTNTATGVTQTVATTPNATYQLTFWVGNVYDPGGIFGVSSTVNVLVNGVKVFSGTNSQKSTTQVWQEFKTSIKATSSKTKVALINGDPPSDTNNGLDAVSLH